MTQGRTTQAREVFELPIDILASDIDQLGHVNNVSYVRWVQDAAVAHWTAAAPADVQAKLLWVVLRHEIDYKRAAFLEDKIIARTWVGSASRLAFERHTEIVRAADGALLAKVLTTWCPIDAKTGRPADPGVEVRAKFSV
jgi:acyl-CoA thioester hydrolase